MSNLISLLKVSLLNEFKLNTLINKKIRHTTDQNSIIPAYVFTGAILGVVFYQFCDSIAVDLNMVGQIDILLYLSLTCTVLIVLGTSIYKSSGYLLSSKDYDLLASLPIKNSVVLISKMILLLISNYLFSIISLVIPLVVYFQYVEFSMISLLNSLILFMTTPLIPIIVASLISLIIGDLASRFKYTNIILIVGSMLAIVSYITIMGRLNDIVYSLLKNSGTIIDAFEKMYPISKYFVEAIRDQNLISILIYTLINLVIFTVFCFITANKFNVINSKMGEEVRNNSYLIKELKVLSVESTLIKKEIKRYLSSFIYVLNTSAGMVMLLMATISVVTLGVDKVNEIMGLSIEMSQEVDAINPCITLMVAFTMMTSCTTSASISIEGNKFWILKTLPLDVIDIIKSKIFVNLVLLIPISILSVIVTSIKFKFDSIYIITMIIMVISLSIFISQNGILINLLYPDLQWTKEVIPVKHSSAVLYAILSNLVYLVIFVLLYILLGYKNFNIFLIGSTVFTSVINFVIWKIIESRAPILFNNID